MMVIGVKERLTVVCVVYQDDYSRSASLISLRPEDFTVTLQKSGGSLGIGITVSTLRFILLDVLRLNTEGTCKF